MLTTGMDDNTTIYAEIEQGQDDCLPIMGGDSTNPTWEEYIARFSDERQPHIRGIRECIEREGLVGVRADKFCNGHNFKCEDGTRICFSWRAWGDLMQAIVGKREGYLTYYC